jgi:hypothetical protein
MRLSKIAVILGLLLAHVAAAQELSPELRAKADQLLNIQKRWGPKLNTPGAELMVKPVTGSPVSGAMVMYGVYAKGLPTDLTYQLVMLPINGAGPEGAQVMGGDLTIATVDGALLDGPSDPRTILAGGYSSGEPMRLALLSKDGQYKAYLSVVPDPIEGHDHSCRISVIRLLAHFELAAVQGAGFPPNSDVQLHGNSSGEVHEGPVKTDENGNFETGLMPFVKGKKSEKMDVKLTAPNCKPSASFRWGAD